MTLTITKSEDEQRQMAMSITVDDKRVVGEMKKIARNLAKNMNVPGFRPGKAPFRVVAKRVGEDALRAQALEDMINDVIFEAMEQEEVIPYARPSLTEMELSPAKIDIVVPLEPVVTLGDYRALRRKLKKPKVSKEAVQESIDAFIARKSSTETVEDRKSKKGDIIKVAGKGLFDEVEEGEDEVFFDEEDGVEFTLDKEETFKGTDFVKNLTGVNVGDDVEFSITYPEDYEISDFAGRKINFELDILELSNKIVPKLTDELVQEDNYDDVKDFKAKTKKTLEDQAFETFRGEVLDEWIADLKKDATLVYPPGAVDSELDDRLEGFKQQISQYGWKWEDYMNMQGESEDGLKEMWRDDAVENLENGLLLRQFISEEYLSLEQEEINELVDERMESFGSDLEDEMKETMRQVLTSGESLQRMSNELMVRKSFDRIEAILAGKAPDLEELKAAAEAEKAAAEAESAEEDQAEETPEPAEAETEENVEAGE